MDEILVIGIGNSSRGDDGLGWAFLDLLGQTKPAGIRLEYRYQLLVEDAELLTRFSKVVFVDACRTPLPDGVSFEPCRPDPAPSLYTHQQTPGAVLQLSRALYGHEPEAWCLLIQGYEWAFDTGLSEQARGNLERALKEVWKG